MLYPQNGDRTLTIDSVTLLHPVYNVFNFRSSNILKHGMKHNVSENSITKHSCILLKESKVKCEQANTCQMAYYNVSTSSDRLKCLKQTREYCFNASYVVE